MSKPFPSPVPDELAGRRALVTGGTRGIGAATAQRLLDAGATVVVTARTTSDEAPAAATFIPADLRSADGAKQLVDAAVQQLGGLDVLVNNAGASRVFPGSAAIPDDEWQDSLDVNFLSAVRVTTAALAALKGSGDGAIVNVSSGVAIDPMPPVLHYAAAKAALLTYNRGLSKELASQGIRVNAVTLGPVDTAGGTDVLQGVADLLGAPLEALTAGIPLGRRGEPRDVAEAIAFLASDRAQWITGANLILNGGA